MKPTTNNKNPGKVVFFKIGERVRKAIFHGDSISDLQDTFLDKFSDVHIPKETLKPFRIVEQEAQSAVGPKELTDIGDVKNFVVLEYPDGDGRHNYTFGKHSTHREKLVVLLVGLPATGKTFIAQKLSRYLNWIGVQTQVFSVADHRRKILGLKAKPFDPQDEKKRQERYQMAMETFDKMSDWLREGDGKVAIYDNTNITQDRRDSLKELCQKSGFQFLFVESICEDATVIEENLKITLIDNPDYFNMTEAEAREDFKRRTDYYKSQYSELDDNTPYIKLFDVGRKVISNNIHSYLECRIVFFLMNIHLVKRPIWLTRHGESQYNTVHKVGGDPSLTEKGEKYAELLGAWVTEKLKTEKKIALWTSTLVRTIQTAKHIPLPKNSIRSLDEIDSGDFDGMTYDEIAENYPEEYAGRAANKLTYRYPRGESYLDVIERLEPFLFEMERSRTPLLVVAHQAVLRCLYAYLMNKAPDECPFLPIELGTVIEIWPKAYGFEEKHYKLL